MRIFSRSLLFLYVIVSFGCSSAQPPANEKAAAGANANGAPAAQVHANLAQVMRGIVYPASNVLFAAQDQNPADIKPAVPDPATSPNLLTSAFGQWQAVENSSLALAESANLLTIPGRKCSNGRDVPLNNADWQMYVQQLRDAGMAAYKAAQSKNQDNILTVTDTVSTACSNCHDKYREKPGGEADRCM
jgi:hypothetical protein